MKIIDLSPSYEYIPAKEKVVSDYPAFGLGQTIGGMTIDAQQLSQGKVIIQGVAERILIGDATAPLTGIGIFIGSDQATTVGYDFRAGNPAGQYIHWDASAGTFIIAGTIVIGGQYRTVAVGDNIQTAIDAVNAAGGGVVVLQNGTHTPGQDLTLYSKITLQGQNGDSAIIDFASGSYQIKAIGSGAYVTGTVTVANNGTTVTGSGTSWTGNVTAGQYIMLAGIWYPITVVTDNTHLTIGLPFADVALSGAAYTAATILSNVKIFNLTVKNSAVSAIKIKYVNNLFMDDVSCTSSLTGLELDTCSQIGTNNLDMIANYSNYLYTNSHFMTSNGCSSVDALTGNGYTLNGVTNTSISASFVLNSAADGLNVTSCSNMKIDIVTAENAGSGIEFVSGNNNIIFGPSRVESNGADGVKLTLSSDNIFVQSGFIKGNTGYGVNIVDSSCDNTVITSNNFSGNTTASVNDSGTGTVIRGNVGVSDNALNSIGGDAVDGTYTLDGTQAAVTGLFSKSSNTYTLLKSAIFDSLTVSVGITLITNGYRISATRVTNAGTIHNNGSNASGTTGGVGGAGNDLTAGTNGGDGGTGGVGGGVGGTNGTSKNPSIGSNGVAGGNSDTGILNDSPSGVSANGGTAGTATAETLNGSPLVATALTAGAVTTAFGNINGVGATSGAVLSASAGSGGGASGGGTGGSAGGNGGGAGGTGGIVEIIANIITNSGTISANGGNGANGVNGNIVNGTTGSAGGGGGGGGSGGSVILIYQSLTNTGSIVATGGTPGTGGSHGYVGFGYRLSASGTTGLAGKVYKLKLI